MLPTKNKSAPVSSALAEAQNILDSAEEKAKAIIEDAMLSAEEIKETGYREGLRIGKDTATKNAIKIIKEHDVIKTSLEKHAANLTYQILEQIFLLNNTDIIFPIQQLAKKLLVTMPVGGNIDIVFHPSHTASLSAIQEELRNISRNTNINFLESYEIDPSTLAIKTDFGEIKVGLREFFTEIAKQLRLPN